MLFLVVLFSLATAITLIINAVAFAFKGAMLIIDIICISIVVIIFIWSLINWIGRWL